MNAQQLRNSILQMAIQGKLVPQDPNDEPAGVLLERIRQQKEQLVKEGKLKKKDLVTTPVAEEEMPFELPESWEWVRLGTIVKNRDSERIPLSVSMRERQTNKIYNYYGPGGAFDKVNDYIFNKRLLLIGEDGANLLTKSKPNAFFAEGKYWVNNHVHVLDSYIEDDIILDYIALRINGMSLADYVTGTAQPKMNQEKMNTIPIPLPPLAEQRRIVAKLEELLPLVEQYGKAQDSLDALNADLPRRLRQSILQQAIQGKLVPQDPNDEPASVLLEKAFSVKKKMISEKIVKADKLDTPVSEDEFVFELPNGWTWVRLNNVHIIARGGSPRPIKEYLTNAEDGVNWIKIGDTEKGGKYINSTHEKIKPTGVCHSRMIHKGDFLLTNSMSFGRPYISNVEGCIHDGWLVISPAYGTVFDQDYLYYLLSSPFTFDQFSGKVAGAVVQNLNSDKVATSVFPLPPLAEQRRIVAKIEELFNEIEKMKDRLE